MTALVRHAVISAPTGKVLLDGQAFPFHVAAAGPTVDADFDGFSVVYLPVVVTESVVVIPGTRRPDDSLDVLLAAARAEKEG